jgi:hypothetical protein
MNALTPGPPPELPSRRVQLAEGTQTAPPPATVADPPEDTEPNPDVELVAALSAEWGWGW